MARRRPTEPTVNPARGAALVVVAVLVGLFLLRNGLDTSEVVRASGDDDTEADAGAAGSDTGTDAGPAAGPDEGSTDDTGPGARTPAEMHTIGLTGSGTGGAARRDTAAMAWTGARLDGPNGGTPTPH